MRSHGRRLAELLLWGTALVCGAVARVRWRDIAVVPNEMPDLLPHAPILAPKIRKDSLVHIVQFTAEHNPFRLNHQPATSAAVANDASGGVVTAMSLRPSLVLKGIVGGAPTWQAVIEGIPGRQGSVAVAKGDTLAGLRIRRVGRDTVVVEAGDTTFRLTLQRPAS